MFSLVEDTHKLVLKAAFFFFFTVLAFFKIHEC